MTLRRHDLNLIPILHALLRHKNVTRAGHEVGLSQSATSHALMRLRDVFNDPLLVASGRDMILSRKAEDLLSALQGTVASLEQLFERQDFDPASSTRHFSMATSDYVCTLLLPGLIRRLQAEAPNVTLEMVWDIAEANTRLTTGRLDLDVRPAGTLTGDDIVSERLYQDELVVVAAKNNPVFDESIDLETVRKSRLIVFRRNQTTVPGFAESQLCANNISLDEALFVPNFVMIPFIVAETNYISLLHRRFVLKIQEKLDLKHCPPPFPVAEFHLESFWSSARERDPSHRWFRHLVRDVIRSL